MFFDFLPGPCEAIGATIVILAIGCAVAWVVKAKRGGQ